MLKNALFRKTAYVSHCPGHKNSKGELAEWCVKSHEDGHIISSHGSEAAAKKHLQDMHAHSGSVRPDEGREIHVYRGYSDGSTCYICGRNRKHPNHKKDSAKSNERLIPRKRAHGYYNFSWQGNDALLFGSDKKTVLLSGKAAHDFQTELERIEDEIPHDKALEAAVNDFIQSYFDALNK